MENTARRSFNPHDLLTFRRIGNEVNDKGHTKRARSLCVPAPGRFEP
jgi:hypothetical protein